jgi:hypothetical protein
MNIRNKQLNRKNLIGLALCTVLVVILASFVLSFFATASTPDTNKKASTPTLNQRATATVRTQEATPTTSTKSRIAQASPNPVSTPTVPAAAPGPGKVTPMLLGTNLSLKDSSDPVLSSATTRTRLQQMHVGLLRIPLRDQLPITTVIQAAQTVKSLNMVPLIILQGDQASSHALENNTKAIQAMNQIFGQGVVYYEYGNEEDLSLPLTAQAYTDSWNRLIPQLKKIALNGHFIGPVNYQYNGPYLQYFLQHATPRPNEVSWHEYTCGSQDTSDFCLSHLDNWSKHFNDARARMSAVGISLPIMITEWNYTANPAANDGKSDNDAFMTAWTSKALQAMATNGIFAAAQFSCTNYQIPLIDSDNTLTAQGQVFQKFGSS